MPAHRGDEHHLYKSGEFAGDRGMQHRDYQQGWKIPPARFLAQLVAWRKRARKWLRGLKPGPGNFPNTVVLWQGPSRLTWPTTQIAVVASQVYQTKATKPNPKTGPMVQIYIMPVDESPMDVVRTGRDAPVCGQCPHRPSLGGRCYVSTQFGPTQVWKSMMWRDAPRLTLPEARRLLRDAVVRIGAWGDPAAVPLHVWEQIVSAAAMHTAYTHQWRDLGPEWSRWCMASVDDTAELAEAQSAGWRTFRVLWDGDEPLKDERQCPAQAHKVPCFSCRGCGGNIDDRRVSFYVTPHGGRLGRGQASSKVPRPGSEEARRLGPRGSTARRGSSARLPRLPARHGLRHRGREARPLCKDWRPLVDVVDNGRSNCPACEEIDSTS
jgi:hypothetical protein